MGKIKIDGMDGRFHLDILVLGSCCFSGSGENKQVEQKVLYPGNINTDLWSVSMEGTPKFLPSGVSKRQAKDWRWTLTVESVQGLMLCNINSVCQGQGLGWRLGILGLGSFFLSFGVLRCRVGG